MTNLEKTKLIDRYLSGEMSKEQQLDFEGLLSEQDSSYNGTTLSLQEEMELQKEIESAIRERGLREMLQKNERKIRQRGRIVRLTIGAISALSIAAVIIGFIFVTSLTGIMYDESLSYQASMQAAGMARGNITDSLSIQLDEAQQAIANDKWDTAAEKAIKVMQLSELKKDDISDEERIEKYQEAQWILLQCEMHNKHYFKAKKMLKQIAAEEGWYQQKAQKILEKL